MPQLQDLPPELIVMICKHVGSAPGLVGLSATRRYFYNIANAEMYIFDAHQERSSGPSALHWAAYKNDLTVARKALDAGVDPDRYWNCVFPRARVDAILASGQGRSRIDHTGPKYWTAMHLAVARGNLGMVKLLLRYNASVNVFSSGFCSCINPALDIRDFSLTERCHQPGEEPWSLLHTAFCFGRDDIAEILAIEGAIVYNYRTDVPFESDVRQSHENLMIPDDTLALEMAGFYGCHRTLDYLISDAPRAPSGVPGVDINTPDVTRRTILCSALFGEAPQKVVPVLVSAGADVNSDTLDGNKVLYETCWEGRFAAALELLNSGADIDCKQSSPYNTLIAACCRRATASAIPTWGSLDHYPGPISFGRSLYHDPLKPPTSWPKYQIEKNSKARYEIVRSLLAQGVDTEERTGLYGNPTALYIAAEGHLHDIVELLLSHGANVWVRNSFGYTTLMAAIASGFAESPLETVKCLLKYGVDVNAQNLDGDTALHLLRTSRFSPVLGKTLYQLLLDNRANLLLANNKGELA